MSMIYADKIRVSSDGRIILDDLSISIERGDWLCVAGDTGSGKSSLLNVLLGLAKPESGSISLGDGVKSASIAFMPQSSDTDQVFPQTVHQIVSSGMLGGKRFFARLSKSEKEKAQEVMNLLDIADLSERRFADLSGGQKQKVLIARAICSAKEMIVLDEPDNGLDKTSVDNLLLTLKHLNLAGITIITTCSDVSLYIMYASHFLLLDSTPPYWGTASDMVRNGFIKGV